MSMQLQLVIFRLQMHLFGQTPETALLSALAAIEFYNNQLQASYEFGYSDSLGFQMLQLILTTGLGCETSSPSV
jgi:hypothetical protein